MRKISYIIKRLLLIIFISVFTLLFNYKSDNTFPEKYQINENISVRKLLSKNNFSDDNNESKNVWTNCTTPAIDNFPTIEEGVRKSLLMSLFSCFLVIYFFIGTALMCDQYFVPSLEVICDKLNLESDIAGSTFMAAGSSAPELAASLIGVFVAKDDIGVGTVVGSAIFNIAFVISICALFAGRVVSIDWWPIFRDSLFYLISICLLFVVMFDKKVSLIESIAFLVIYLLYIIFMAYNQIIQRKISPKLSKIFGLKNQESNTVAYNTIPETNLLYDYNSSSASDVECIVTNSESNFEGITSEVTPNWLKSLNRCSNHLNFAKIWNTLIYPMDLAHRFTVVDCREESKRKWFGITFLMSCLWISIYSYVIIWMITLIGYNLRIPDTVMGLIFIAGGASIPDAISSLIVVRQGLGNMALTNAIGSNVFDILVCLGFPWLLQTAIINPGSHVDVISRGLEYSTLSLISTVVFFLVTTHFNEYKLTKRYGLILMVWYFVFITMASLYELNVFGQFNPPMCWHS